MNKHSLDNIKLIQDEKDENSFTVDFGFGKHVASEGASDSVDINGGNKYALAIDVDEVLVNISDKWLDVLTDDPVLKDYFKAEHAMEISLGQHIKNATSCLRSEYFFPTWLNITDPEHVKRCQGIYFNDPNYYDDLKPTLFMEHLRKILPFVSEINLVTSCGESLDLPVNASKKRWIAKYFGDILRNKDIKFGLHMLTSGQGKGKYMAENGIHFTTFVDDHIPNILDVARYSEFDNFEVLVPLLGYNSDVAAIKKSIDDLGDSRRSFKLTHFHNLREFTQEEFIKATKEYYGEQPVDDSVQQ